MESEIVAKDPTHREKTQTNFEIFSATDGSLRVTEFYELGRLVIKYGSCTATLIRSRNTQSNTMSIALRVEFKNANGREYRSILDEDELVSLDGALNYLEAHKTEMIRKVKTYTEVVYKSRGGFQAGLYITEKREVGEYMSVGGETVFFHTLDELRRINADALFRIETLRSN